MLDANNFAGAILVYFKQLHSTWNHKSGLDVDYKGATIQLLGGGGGVVADKLFISTRLGDALKILSHVYIEQFLK